MKPMLAHTFEPHRWTSGPAYVQPKLDGIRALYQGGYFQSREELPWNPRVLAHLILPLLDMFDHNVILDGELYVHGWSLQRINGAVQIARTEIREDTRLVEYHIFDRVSKQPFNERFELIRQKDALFTGSKVQRVRTFRAETQQQVDTFYRAVIANRYEGIMYRLGDCPYTVPKQPNGKKFLSDKNNRTWHLLKRKSWEDGEFVCLEVNEGIGKRSNMVGAFTCGTPEGATFDVGSGLTDTEAIHFLQHPPIGRKVKVKYHCLTPGGIPFHPIFLAIL